MAGHHCTSAARKGHLPVVQYLCEQGADKEARDDDGSTPLLWAALNGHLPVVQYLCEQGADKEARDNGQDTTDPCLDEQPPVRGAVPASTLPLRELSVSALSSGDVRPRTSETSASSLHQVQKQPNVDYLQCLVFLCKEEIRVMWGHLTV